jgi:hypothetical protein
MADHPVKVPPELFTEWLNEALRHTSLNAKTGTVAAVMADKAAQWGADQELMVCMDAIYLHEGRPLCGGTAEWLRSIRRPKPPSLAERALEQYERVEDILLDHDVIPAGCIRAALTRLAELEVQQ